MHIAWKYRDFFKTHLIIIIIIIIIIQRINSPIFLLHIFHPVPSSLDNTVYEWLKKFTLKELKFSEKNFKNYFSMNYFSSKYLLWYSTRSGMIFGRLKLGLYLIPKWNTTIKKNKKASWNLILRSLFIFHVEHPFRN